MGGGLPEQWRRSGLHCDMCRWVLLHVRHSWLSMVTTLRCISYFWLAVLVLLRLAGWVGILGHMPIRVGVMRHAYIAGGVPANEVPVHWVNQPDSKCFNNTDGEIILLLSHL
jgi:hypothetical protein